MNMPKRILLFDSDYLCHRALHSTGHLQHEGQSTGVIFGVVSEIIRCIRRFQPDEIATCFDHGKSYRFDIFPDYKFKRVNKVRTPDEQQARNAMDLQRHKLKETILPLLQMNPLYINRFEADDLLGYMVNKVYYDQGKNVEITIVSADQDLYQLLWDNTAIWNPSSKRLINLAQFKKDWGLPYPTTQWAEVKAIAGCASDEIPGVDGVGEKTAVAYLTSHKCPRSKIDRIEKFVASSDFERNVILTTIPLQGHEQELQAAELQATKFILPTSHQLAEMLAPWGIEKVPTWGNEEDVRL